jgi:hypothetical protein
MVQLLWSLLLRRRLLEAGQLGAQAEQQQYGRKALLLMSDEKDQSQSRIGANV